MEEITAEALEGYRRGWRQREAKRREEREAARLTALAAARQAILTLATGWPSVRRIYLFGSVIEPGMFRPDSDIDIAIEGATAEAYFDFWRALQDALPKWWIDVREIDVSSYFADCVRSKGILIYERKN